MEENTGNSWYLNINLIIFLLALVSMFLFMFAAEKHFSAAVDVFGSKPSILSVDSTDGQEVYLGMPPYGSGIRLTDDQGYFLSRGGVYEELCRIPDDIHIVYINGTRYINEQVPVRTDHGSENIWWYKENLRESDMWSWVSGSNMFQKEYVTDADGNIAEIRYTAR